MTNKHDELLEFWLDQGFKFRLKTNKHMQARQQEYRDRIAMELKVIKAKEGYTDYFLMTSDIVRWAKDHGILVGPGRGSAVGSLACYLLRITEIDSMQYPVMFERFLDPLRTDPPDIDIDFEDERREEAIDYARKKYGNDRVANILNFVRYKGKNSLDDIARVYHVAEWKIQKIKDHLIERAEGHPRFANTLQDTIEANADIQEIVDGTEGLNLTHLLEGNYRNASVHPAGIVVAGVPLDTICATYTKESGEERGSGVAYDKQDSEYLGLLKIDFLSLTTLTAIRATLDALNMSIKEFYEIPLDDPKVYQAFRDGDLLGIFQFEGQATRKVTRQVAPTKFMDLVDINALSRPGGDDKAYVKAKNAAAEGVLPKFEHPVIEQHLGWTWGTIVYQEQIMLILRDLGQFPPEDVNAVRKAISKKLDATQFNVYLEQFVEGCANNGVKREVALDIWSHIVDAAGYGFNISHAVSYSDIAYRQMWLKIYHPEYYLGQLQKCPTNEKGLDRRRRLIVEAEEHGVSVHAPNLLQSGVTWTLATLGGKPHLYAGFTEIKGIGVATASAIVRWREAEIHRRLPQWVGVDVHPDLLVGMENGALTVADLEWEDLLVVSGIGVGRIQTIKEFANSPDPFGANYSRRAIQQVKEAIGNGTLPNCPVPTHNAQQVLASSDDQLVVFAGILKDKHYKDVVEQRIKYGGKSFEEVVESLDFPHLRKYVSLTVEDHMDEPVTVRVSRKKYPQYERLVRAARVNKDVVVAKGFISEFGNLAIQVTDLAIIQLD